VGNLSEIRRRAWVTRREKYGERGHAGSYQRPTLRETLALLLIVRLHEGGVLSEGQCATALQMDRVAFRKICDRLAP